MKHLKKYNESINYNYLYTIGNTINYDKFLIKNILYKSKGGTVWKNYESVLDFYKNSVTEIDGKIVESSIYLVKGDWSKDVTNKYNNMGELIRNCKIIKKLIN